MRAKDHAYDSNSVCQRHGIIIAILANHFNCCNADSDAARRRIAEASCPMDACLSFRSSRLLLVDADLSGPSFGLFSADLAICKIVSQAWCSLAANFNRRIRIQSYNDASAICSTRELTGPSPYVIKIIEHGA